MNALLERLMGVHALTDQVITMDLLISAKSGVRNYAMAVTEAGTPEVKQVLSRQLEDAIAFHERVTAFAIERGWYRPWDVKAQLGAELQNIKTAQELAKLAH